MKPDIYLLQNFDNQNKLSIKKEINTKMHLLHYHDCFEFTFFVSGKGIHFINGKEYSIEPNNFAVFTPNDYHAIYNLSKKSFIYNIMLNPSLLSHNARDILLNIKHPKLCTLSQNSSKQILHLFDIIYDTKNTYPDQFYKNIIDCIVTIFLQNSQKNAAPIANFEQQNPLQQILLFINLNFQEKISLAEISKKFGYSPSHLSELFHKQTGLTFVEYVNHIRIDYVKKKLHFSDESITSIAFNSGFSSITNFSRTFKSFVGITPSVYRKKNNSNLN